MTEPAKTTAVDDARKNRECDLSMGDIQCPYVTPHGDDGYLNCRYTNGHTVPHNTCYKGPPDSKERWFVREPEPAEVCIAELQAQLRQEREAAHKRFDELKTEFNNYGHQTQAQFAQLQTTVDQLRSALGKFMGLKRHKIWNVKNYTHFNMLNSDLQAIDELWASLTTEPSQEKP